MQGNVKRKLMNTTFELSKRLDGTAAGDLFGKLAQEELGHKNKIEREYESIVMKEG